MITRNNIWKLRGIPSVAAVSIALVILSSFAWAQEGAKKTGSPEDNLPPHIRQLTRFGQRADWSHDRKRILFLERTFGDVYEVEVATSIIRPMTHHYYHEGYTRALYLSNGDILLSGARTFDAENTWPSRGVSAELWVLDKSLTKKPVALGRFCMEGPAVSRKNLKIAWTMYHDNYPDRIEEGHAQIWMGNIKYDNGVPKLVDQRKILDTRDLPFKCEPETQNFRPPDETELIFSAYDYQGSEVMGLNIATGKVVNYSNSPGAYEEPEGIFPGGIYTLIERVTSQTDPFANQPDLDIWKLKLDGSGEFTRLTFFSEYPMYRGTNPSVSDDGRFMAFQLARANEPAGVGHGIFIYDFSKAPTP